MSVTEIQQLSQVEKLRLMELLWEDLSRDEANLESPAWHEAALAETKRRVANGDEQLVDWEKAKATLRQRSA